ncbi:WhiB family transcriptional regulator [Demequina capsici]|uniref:WhiB family transcriptional regulator n=1 Tax=Demequina capsici TaxID=3075620 RepID=A0AA96J9Q3_9MICO|nr:WhiB family transcriptional regulator [Demequina sp. PMTSA13]WNM27522.1 WhiB family transcriptional regulator [Demequina sp. PMTSA13]
MALTKTRVSASSGMGDWMTQDTACRGEDRELFFQPDGPGARAWTPAPALERCAVCPVRGDCIMFALRHEQAGVWGLDEVTRKSIRRLVARQIGRLAAARPAGMEMTDGERAEQRDRLYAIEANMRLQGAGS